MTAADRNEAGNDLALLPAMDKNVEMNSTLLCIEKFIVYRVSSGKYCISSAFNAFPPDTTQLINYRFFVFLLAIFCMD